MTFERERCNVRPDSHIDPILPKGGHEIVVRKVANRNVPTQKVLLRLPLQNPGSAGFFADFAEPLRLVFDDRPGARGGRLHEPGPLPIPAVLGPWDAASPIDLHRPRPWTGTEPRLAMLRPRRRVILLSWDHAARLSVVSGRRHHREPQCCPRISRQSPSLDRRLHRHRAASSLVVVRNLRLDTPSPTLRVSAKRPRCSSHWA